MEKYVASIPFEKLKINDKIAGRGYDGIGYIKRLSIEENINSPSNTLKYVRFKFPLQPSSVVLHENLIDMRYLEDIEISPPRMKFEFGLKETIIMFGVCNKLIGGNPKGLRKLFHSDNPGQISISGECVKFIVRTYAISEDAAWTALYKASNELYSSQNSYLVNEYPSNFIEDFEKLLGLSK